MSGKEAKTLRWVAEQIVADAQALTNVAPAKSELVEKLFGSTKHPISTKRTRKSLDGKREANTVTLAYPETSVKRIYKDLKSGKIVYRLKFEEDYNRLVFVAVPR